MIDKIKFQNYKAFDKGEIEIRPLTLLLGANSSGKSSILHLFLMLEQTISNVDKYNAALKTNGHSVSLGEDENVLKDRKHEKQMHLEFVFNAAEYINNIKTFQKETFDGLIGKFLFSKSSIEDIDFPKKLDLIKTNFGIDLSDLKRSDASILDYFISYRKDHRIPDYFSFNLFNFFNKKELLWSKNNDIEDKMSFLSSFKNCFDAFNKTFNLYADLASIKYVLSFNEDSRKLKVTECLVSVGEKVVVHIQTRGRDSHISSEIFTKEDLDKLTQLSKLRFEFDCLSIQSLSKKESFFTEYVKTLFEQAFESVQDFFSKKNMNYVGPLRANPQRYYFLDDSNTNTTLDHRSGASLAEILKKNEPVRDKINKWLERFEFNVDVQEFKDVIHNIKVKQNNLLLDIPDVGFGISQVLPILVVGMMAPQSSTIIMEQPEIHLHPKMQAELADLFIDILQLQSSKKSQINRHLIIETHSEYLIKRIRRRMAEGSISPKHVAIYFVNPRNKEHPDTAEIQLAPISKDGTIEWPEEFYMTELEDEMAFFKAKMRKS